MRKNGPDWGFYGLIISGLILISFMSGINDFLENNRLIGMIDDGKTKDRYVWVPANSSMHKPTNFDKMSETDKKVFIKALDEQDYVTMEKLINQYKARHDSR